MFKYNGKNKDVIKAVAIANDVLFNQLFYMGIRARVPFDNSNVTNDMIANLFKKYRFDIVNVELFTPWNRCYSKVRGRFQPKKPNTVQINKYIAGDAKQVASVLLHEETHRIDNIYHRYSFGHSGNNKHGNEGSAPYQINQIVNELIKS